MTNLSDRKTCSRCSASIPEEAPQGLCPACVLQEAIETKPSGTGEKATPPTLQALREAFPNLEILEFIGQGGMGFVFKARQLKLNRLVALKILPETLAKHPAFAERFSREGQLLARLSHPHVVTVHDFGTAAGFYYLLMEYVDGVNLRQAMRASRFTPDQALSIVPSICAALQYAHEEGVLHRDIKPENILLDVKGRVKIADFGIAKLVSESERESGQNTEAEAQGADLTQSGGTLGTPNYMAPEQVASPSEIDHRADIYSLGVVFYEMLTGELPNERFAPPSSKTPMDPRVDDVVARALEKQRERRYQSAAEVGTSLEAIASTASGAKRPPATIPAAAVGRPVSLSPRFRTVLFVALLVLIGLLLNQILPFVQRFIPSLWQNAQQRPIQGLLTLLGVLGIGWLALKIWRRRDWLLAPLRLPAPSGSWITDQRLTMAWSGLLLCLAVKVLQMLLAAVVALSQGFPPDARILIHYSLNVGLFPLLFPILVIYYFVRREVQRADVVTGRATEWMSRAALLCLMFSIAACLPAAMPEFLGMTFRQGGFVAIRHGEFVALAALAILTLSRLWRTIAIAFLITLMTTNVLQLIPLIGGPAAEFEQFGSANGIDVFEVIRWMLISEVTSFFCLAPILTLLLLPSVRRAFGLPPMRFRKMHGSETGRSSQTASAS